MFAVEQRETPLTSETVASANSLKKAQTRRVWPVEHTKDPHPLQLVHVLLHRQAVQSAGDAEEAGQEAGSETHLQGTQRHAGRVLNLGFSSTTTGASGAASPHYPPA